MSITKDLPVKTVSEFIQYANLHKGELNLGSLGSNSVEEIMGRWFLRDNGLDLIPVPYKGGLSAAMIDLIAGRIHLMFDAIGNSTPHYRAGKIKILGVATTSRVATIAEVPTLKEQGYPFVNGSWLAICAPKNTPSIIINRLNTEIVAAVESDEFQSKIKLLGSIPAHSKSSEEFKNFINTYLSEWAEMTRVLGVEME